MVVGPGVALVVVVGLTLLEAGTEGLPSAGCGCSVCSGFGLEVVAAGVIVGFGTVVVGCCVTGALLVVDGALTVGIELPVSAVLDAPFTLTAGGSAASSPQAPIKSALKTNVPSVEQWNNLFTRLAWLVTGVVMFTACLLYHREAASCALSNALLRRARQQWNFGAALPVRLSMHAGVAPADAG
jgi:uncharacterized membrane protein YedE/YeeE